MSAQPSYDNHLGHSIKLLYHAMDRYFNAFLQPYGIARSQWYMLHAISHTTGLTQKELQAIMQVESATLTTAIDTLVKKGWVERTQSTADRRLKELRLTAAGQKLWQSLPDPILAIRSRLLQGITAKEEETARKILDKTIKNLERTP
jgi:DNA-binding MarR family transcriptional regulator